MPASGSPHHAGHAATRSLGNSDRFHLSELGFGEAARDRVCLEVRQQRRWKPLEQGARRREPHEHRQQGRLAHEQRHLRLPEQHVHVPVTQMPSRPIIIRRRHTTNPVKYLPRPANDQHLTSLAAMRHPRRLRPGWRSAVPQRHCRRTRQDARGRGTCDFAGRSRTLTDNRKLILTRLNACRAARTEWPERQFDSPQLHHALNGHLPGVL